jgi:hypothetical protein
MTIDRFWGALDPKPFGLYSAESFRSIQHCIQRRGKVRVALTVVARAVFLWMSVPLAGETSP